MSESKIGIKIGEIEFSGEGHQDWVAKQLDKILAKAEDLLALAPPAPAPSDKGKGKQKHEDKTIPAQTLPSFLDEKDAKKTQVKKFLATAVWLDAQGKHRIQTKDVAKALSDSRLSRLNNPADCLGKNVRKGYCEKAGKEFFVTEDGKNSL